MNGLRKATWTLCWTALAMAAAAELRAQTVRSARQPNGAGRQSVPTREANQPSAVYDDVAQFGGPTSVGGVLAEDSSGAPRFRLQTLDDHFGPWRDFKSQVNEEIGLQFEIDESLLYQAVSPSPTESDAAAGLVRVFGQWELLGRGSDHPGFLVYKAEHRHRIGSITPFNLGFSAGSNLPTGTFFSEFDFTVTNLYWKQYWFDRQLAVAVGRIDVTDFIVVYARMNPLTHVLNLAFSTNPTIAVPNQGLGAAAGGMLTERLYFQGGFGDANGQPTQAGFDTFFDDSEYFSYVEFGATSSQERIYLDNVHVTLWNAEAREFAGTPSSWGVAFTAQKFCQDRWLPFFRFGYSDGDAALMQTTFSTGLGLARENKDVLGCGVSWGKPTDGSLRDQFTSEVFYRFQLTQFLAITPDAQFIVNPASNPSADALAFFGIRLRAAL
ncbi:MAG: carbohydrate porin [Planctomycetales bacterium]